MDMNATNELFALQLPDFYIDACDPNKCRFHTNAIQDVLLMEV